MLQLSTENVLILQFGFSVKGHGLSIIKVPGAETVRERVCDESHAASVIDPPERLTASLLCAWPRARCEGPGSEIRRDTDS